MLLNGVLRSVFGGRRRHSRRAQSFLGRPLGGPLGAIGGSLLSNPNVLLTAAGVAWGIFETLQQGTPGTSSDPGAQASTPTMTAALPPLPVVATAVGPVSAQALRIVRLAISAALADGAMSDQERVAILEQARLAGVDSIVEQELAQPRPLAEIVAGVTEETQAAALYVLAFGILRGDEQPNGAERIYLAKLADLVRLDPKTVQQLEQNVGKRIDAEPEQ